MVWLRTMRPKTRGLAQHGGLLLGGILCCDGPVHATFHDVCPGLELLSRELLTNPAAVAVFLVLNIYKTPSSLSRKEGMGQNSSQTPAVSLVDSCNQCDRMDNKP
jgi:hypothetical protein